MQPTTAAPPAPTTSADALGQLQSFQGQMKAPQDIYKGQEQSLGIPQAQQQVSGLRQAITNTTNLLNQVAPSVYGRTQNSLVTDAQATRQIGNEQAPLNTQLNTEGQQYTGANADLSNLLGEASTLSGLEQEGQQTKLSNLQNIYGDLSAKEQAALLLDEQKREFNTNADLARKAQAASAGSGLNLGSLASGASSGGGFNIPLRVPGNPSQGFNFGNSNALAYSQAQQIPFRTFLQQLASAGDVGAKAGLGFIGNDGNADPTKITTQAQADLYHALTGRYVPVKTVPVSSIKGSNQIPSFNSTIPSVYGVGKLGR